mmetsp:Transcript_65012/g.103491  ORF Transcript_65012/g.103491 Transcript_65012/m.103491 type:complete len:235 (-) Transcript_65012:13-717(-)
MKSHHLDLTDIISHRQISRMRRKLCFIHKRQSSISWPICIHLPTLHMHQPNRLLLSLTPQHQQLSIVIELHSVDTRHQILHIIQRLHCPATLRLVLLRLLHHIIAIHQQRTANHLLHRVLLQHTMIHRHHSRRTANRNQIQPRKQIKTRRLNNAVKHHLIHTSKRLHVKHIDGCILREHVQIIAIHIKLNTDDLLTDRYRFHRLLGVLRNHNQTATQSHKHDVNSIGRYFKAFP